MRRTLMPELMDDPGLDPVEHSAALRGLARLNRVAQSDAILWGGVRAEAARRRREGRGEPLTLLDIATGSGDLPLSLARRAAGSGLGLDLHACDLSDTALAEANARARALGVALVAWRQDAVREPFERRFDVVTCSLFLHHLHEDDAVTFLRNAAAAVAAGGVLLVSDLRREPAGLGVAWAASRLVTRSRVVHVDAVRSVRGAYTPEEVGRLAERAGLRGARIRRRRPWRMLLSWRGD